MKHRTNLREALRQARAAHHDLASLRHALREAEDNLAGLHRVLKVPNVSPRGSRYSKRTSTGGLPPLANFLARLSGNSLADLTDNALDDNLSLSYGPSRGYASATQAAAQILTLAAKGKRIL